MIDPVHLFVLEPGSTVFEDGHGEQPATRVAAVDYYANHWYPSEENPRTHAAVKAMGANGDVYIREADIEYAVDLDGDEFEPFQP